ncbi:NUDIX domain-containing protein [Thiohalophilus thiocyanatoxydans]|uniref:Phosphatase NudJ n=2 Tax=Thiohalophilus thiocyanatoxydans TaxID=381308 RepID=A0A4R8IR30_9GAMM|nr:NUDIX domain-containing protein [Thiohalophilus thiocyanatoxydans]
MVEEDVEGRIVLNQPAGHVEAGESFLQAVKRETLEETAHHFEPQAVTGIYRWMHPDNGITFVRHAFCGVVGEPDTDLALDEGILRALWLGPDELRAQADKLRSPLVMQSIEDYLNGQRYPLKLYRDIE